MICFNCKLALTREDNPSLVARLPFFYLRDKAKAKTPLYISYQGLSQSALYIQAV